MRIFILFAIILGTIFSIIYYTMSSEYFFGQQVQNLDHIEMQQRLQALYRLSKHPEKKDTLLPILQKKLSIETSWECRVSIVACAKLVGAEKSIPILLQALSDPTWQVRLQSVVELTRLEQVSKVAIADLQKLQNDENPEVRRAVKLILERFSNN